MEKSKKNKQDRSAIKEGSNTVPNIRPDPMDLPPLNPTVPNRAWTAMKSDKCADFDRDGDDFSDENGVY